MLVTYGFYEQLLCYNVLSYSELHNNQINVDKSHDIQSKMKV